MSHLAKDILKGNFGRSKALKREAREELMERGGKTSAERMKYFKRKGPLKEKLPLGKALANKMSRC